MRWVTPRGTLEVMDDEQLIANATAVGRHLVEGARALGIRRVDGGAWQSPHGRLGHDGWAGGAHAAGRAIAVHCVTRGELFLTLAAALAYRRELQVIVTGVCETDFSGYPDCRPEFLQAFESLANLATKAGTEGAAATVPVTLSFDSPPPGLRIGASAAVDIEVGRREDALYLPRGPYLTTGGERVAYVAEGETAVRQSVVFGLIDGERVEVVDGLSEGQRVVVSSYEAFIDRETVRLAPEGEIQ